MSPRRHRRPGRAARGQAPVFAALGDETRLALLATLSRGGRMSISRLTTGAGITRQGITKHLRVLEKAGLVRGLRKGRERVFQIAPRRLSGAQRALDRMSRQWDEALQRLRVLVED